MESASAGPCHELDRMCGLLSGLRCCRRINATASALIARTSGTPTPTPTPMPAFAPAVRPWGLDWLGEALTVVLVLVLIVEAVLPGFVADGLEEELVEDGEF